MSGPFFLKTELGLQPGLCWISSRRSRACWCVRLLGGCLGPSRRELRPRYAVVRLERGLGLEEMHEDGIYDRIYQKWFGKEQ